MQTSNLRTFLRPVPVPRMPAGLVQLMEEMAKEVLRHNPPDVYDFCAKHFEKLLIIRDGKAPKKQKLSVEQKIKIAQEKVRERAEQRRQRYDQEMKKDAIVDTSAIVVSEVATSDLDSKETESTLPEELNKLLDDVVESKLKEPVHHEKELTEALEVEIFHESIKTSEFKNKSIVPVDEVKEIIEKDLSDKVEENSSEISKEQENIVGEKVDSDSVVNKSDLDNQSVNLNDSDEPCEQNRIRRSIDTGGQNEDNNPLVDVNNDQNIKELENVAESIDTILELNETETKNNSNENLINVVNDSETVNQNKSMDKKDENIIDRAPLFAIEVSESAPSEYTEIEFDNNKEIIASTIIAEPSTESILVDNQMEKIVTIDKDTIDVGEEFISALHQKTEDNVAATEETGQHNNEDKVTHQQSELKVEDDLEHGDIKDTELPGEYALTDENGRSIERETLDFTESATASSEVIKEQSDEELKQINNNIIEEAQGSKIEDSEKNENSNDFDEKKILESNDEYCTNEIENKVVDEKATKHNPEEEPSEAITTVEKVLVDESASINDDNDAAPSENMDSQNIVDNQEQVNGNYDNNNEDIVENRDETLKSKEMFAPESIIETDNVKSDLDHLQNVLKSQDHVSNVLEVEAKTETRDIYIIEKSSNIDDSVAVEGEDSSVIEITSDKNNPESVLLKENQTAMDLETAAVTIQKVFRSFMFKRSTFDETGIEGNNSIDDDSEKVDFPVTSTTLNKERRTLGISRMDTVLQTVNEEKSLSLSTDDSSLSSAATIIQAHVRGFLVRNRLNSNRTNSTSLGKSEGPSTSLEADNEQKVNKTVLNIHIVPEGEHFLSRDESLLTSMELSLDGSPPSSTNLHPLGYDKSERRKQLKREDAIQSISPPSNNSGKLSEDVDSVKDMIVSDEQQKIIDSLMTEPQLDVNVESRDDTPTKSTTIETVIEAHRISTELSISSEPEKQKSVICDKRKRSLIKANSDESDVVCEDKGSTDSDNTLGLLHSGEFHDIVLPTKVSRADTTIVRGE